MYWFDGWLIVHYLAQCCPQMQPTNFNKGTNTFSIREMFSFKLMWVVDKKKLVLVVLILKWTWNGGVIFWNVNLIVKKFQKEIMILIPNEATLVLNFITNMALETC